MIFFAFHRTSFQKLESFVWYIMWLYYVHFQYICKADSFILITNSLPVCAKITMYHNASVAPLPPTHTHFYTPTNSVWGYIGISLSRPSLSQYVRSVLIFCPSVRPDSFSWNDIWTNEHTTFKLHTQTIWKQQPSLYTTQLLSMAGWKKSLIVW